MQDMLDRAGTSWDTPALYILDSDKNAAESLGHAFESRGVSTSIFQTAQAFFEAYDQHRPSCVLLELRLAEMDGLEVQRRLRGLGDPPPVIAISAQLDVPTVVESMKLGAVDVLQKPVSTETLLDCARAALAREVERHQQRDQDREVLVRRGRLTAREREVMALVVEGLANKQVARQLGLSPKTVEIHRGNLMRKMRAGSLAELVRMAYAASYPGSRCA